MKKIIFTFLIMILCVANVSASGMSFEVVCPTGGKASSTVSCTVSVSSTTSTPLCAISAKLSISNATFVSFEPKISLYQNTSSGFVYDSSSQCISSKTNIGTLKIKMPSSGNASISYTSIQGSNSTGTIKSTASNVTKSIRVYDSNNNLISLVLSVGNLSPKFSSNTTSYSSSVTGDVSSITITANAESTRATISGTGKKNLSYGNNKFTITVKSEAGTTKSYIVNVNRADNRRTDNNLSSLSITNVKIVKDFSENITSYTANVNATTTSVQVNAKVKDLKASFVNGYGPRKVNLKYGVNTIEIKVKAENGSIKTYTIKVTRADDRSTNNFLKTLSVSNSGFIFDKNKLAYTLSVKNNIDSVEIKAEAEDSKSTITGIGTIKLKEGINEVKINVKAENGSIKTYILTIKRLTLQESLSSNTNLNKLEIKNYNIEFSKNILDYVIDLKEDEKLEINAEAEDETSIINIIGNNDLKDNSLIKINVTSTDGSLKTYNLIIDKKEINKDNDSLNVIYLIIIIMETLLLTLLIFYILRKSKDVETSPIMVEDNNEDDGNYTNIDDNENHE